MPNVIYLFNKYPYWIFQTCCIISIFSPSKCRLFHNATSFGFCITHILNTECAKIWNKKSVSKRLIEHLSIWCVLTSSIHPFHPLPVQISYLNSFKIFPFAWCLLMWLNKIILHYSIWLSPHIVILMPMWCVLVLTVLFTRPKYCILFLSNY